MHDAAFAALGIDASYMALDVTPDALGSVVAGFRSAPEFVGANVTVPHKSAVMRWLDEVDETASAIGAVNTIVRLGGTDGRLVGRNTDADGFVAALDDVVPVSKLRGAMLLGAGGSARAVAWTLVTRGVDVAIVNRSRDRAARLVAEVGAALAASGATALAVPGGRGPGRLSVCEPDEAGALVAECDLLVNATSVGMLGGPAPEASPSPAPLSSLPPGAVVCDLVYRPALTPLLREARDVGVIALNGLPMLVHQGAASFTMWTGRPAPVQVMFEALGEALS